jgi:hypothetical protein
MPFPSLSGSHNTDSPPVNEQPSNIQDVYDQVDHVRDVTVEKNAFNSSDFKVDRQLILGYLEGHKIQVTYYHVESSTYHQRSSPSDTTAKRDNIEIPLTKISEFELILPSNIGNLDWNQDASAGTVTGEGMVYSGFNAKIGDLFIYSLGEGRVGLFTVASVQPLSIYSTATHRISFILKNANVDTSERHLIEDRVVKHLYFDKRAFLTGDRILLTADSKLQSDTLKRLTSNMISFYYKKFYSYVSNSVVAPSPDYAYDPYIVEFLNKIVTIDQSGKRLRQLYPKVNLTYDYSIWARMLSFYNNSISGLVQHYRTTLATNTYVDVDSTGLTNKPYLMLITNPELGELELPSIQEGYILSSNFYTRTLSDMDDFEKIVLEAIETRKISDIGSFITNYGSQFYELDTLEQFRYIPILIWICSIAQRQLTSTQ